MNDKKIIYIAGYGRSGSTLLERILSSHEKIFGAGALSNFLDLIDDKNSSCSCGKAIQKCEFWSDVVKSFSSDFDNIPKFKNIQNQFDSLSGFPAYIFGHCTDKKVAYREFIQKLFNNIFQKLPDEVSYVVDSSKTARQNFFRPVALSKIGSFHVKIIHLVRDGRGCMWSNLKGSNRRMEKGLDPRIPFAALRSAVSWFLANISAHICQAIFPPEDYCRIKYEDFVEKPKEALLKLGEFLDVDFHKQIEMLEKKRNIPLAHQIGGNRLRLKREIILKKDVEWKSKLKLRYKLLFWLLDWPLALFYGYK